MPQRSQSTETRSSSASEPQQMLAGVEVADVQAQLERILASHLFRRSKRLTRFLEFVVGQALAGKAEQLNEFAVGMAVFDKQADFDTRADPIVRVEAGRLRAKIREYYARFGADDPVYLGIRQRGYRPVVRRRRIAAPNAAPADAQAPAKDERPSVAVLPFSDLSPQQTHDRFCEALTHSVVNALARERAVRVASRTVARREQHEDGNIAELAERLGVAHIVEGSVQRHENKVRVVAEITRAADGESLWGATLDRELDDIFQLQDDMTRDIVESIRQVLLCGDAEEACEDESESGVALSSAYADYLKGVKQWSLGTVSGLHASIESFERACQRDPGHAETWAGLASARVGLALCRAENPGALMDGAKTAARRALEIDDGLAEAHAVLGAVQALCDCDWVAAEASLECARALAPELPMVELWRSLALLLPRGDVAGARAGVERAHRANPTAVMLHYYRGKLLFYAEQYEDAARVIEVAVELEPDFGVAQLLLGDVYAQQGRIENAMRSYEKASAIATTPPGAAQAAIAYGHACAGRPARATRMLRAILRAPKHGHAWPYAIAVVYAALGQVDEAFAWLGRAREDGVPRLLWLASDPRMVKLRDDPRFGELLTRLGLQTSPQHAAAT